MLTKWRSVAAATAVAGLLAVGGSFAASAEPVEITMWDIPESEPYTAWWKAHVEKFNQDHPDIHVTLEVFESEAYRSKLSSALVAGTAADIFYIAVGPQGFQAVRDGQARPLDGILDTGKFADSAIAACSVDGKVACMPLYIAPNLFYYNKKMFAQAGVDPEKWANPLQPTAEEFEAALGALKGAGLVPIALGNADSWPGAMYLWSYQNRFGGLKELAEAVHGEGGNTFATTPSFTKAAEAIVALGKSDYLPLGYNGIGGGQKYALFTAGQGAIIFQGPWMLGYIVTDAPKDFEFGFFNFPSYADGPADSQQDVLGGFDALWVSANTKHPEAVATFLNSFADKDTAVSFQKDTQNISVIKEVLAATAGSDDVVARMGRLAGEAPHITPWWDSYLSAPLHEEGIRLIQGLFDESVTPADYLAAMDKVAGR
jgi:raffinose/stachyose/melibiose transport system substrate-binding protein